MRSPIVVSCVPANKNFPGKPDCPEDEQSEAEDQQSKAEDTPLRICALRSVEPALEPAQPDAADSAEQKLRFGMLADDKMLQCNVVADSTTKEHVVEWRWTDAVDPESAEAAELRNDKGRGAETADGEFVRALKLGDVVTVWAKSRFPGWVNHVESVRVDVFWAI